MQNNDDDDNKEEVGKINLFTNSTNHWKTINASVFDKLLSLKVFTYKCNE